MTNCFMRLKTKQMLKYTFNLILIWGDYRNNTYMTENIINSKFKVKKFVISLFYGLYSPPSAYYVHTTMTLIPKHI